MSTAVRMWHDIGELRTGEVDLYLQQVRVARLQFRICNNILYVDQPEAYRRYVTAEMLKYLWDTLTQAFHGYRVVVV